jgi:hypothetical protein
MRHATVLVLLLLVAAGCGDSSPRPPPSKATVVRAMRSWVRSAQGHDPDDFCARTMMLYDTASPLWGRLEFTDPPDTPPPPATHTATPARVRQDCFAEFVFKGHFKGALLSGTRIVAIRRVKVEGPVRHGGGIARTAVVEFATRHHERPAQYQRYHLALYRGRWRVLIR